MSLNSYDEIVSNLDSPTLVLAGPGSGKTFLLGDRVKWLLDLGIDKTAITVLAFGVDASQNMKDKLLDPDGMFKLPYEKLPFISTMHSLGLKIVLEKPHDVNLLKTNLEIQYNDSVKYLMYRDAALILGLPREYGISALQCKQCGDCNHTSKEKKCEICNKYREIMSKCNYIDFDDQILFACQILENNPSILLKYQTQCSHLLVDEYQDINAAQFRLIELLSKRSQNGLFVVGDDAQSIYSFRGGYPKFILNFKKNFPAAEMANLAHSRRCPENIMKDAFKILKKYYSDWTGEQALKYHKLGGDEPVILQFPSELAEAEMVAKICKRVIPQKKVLILVQKADFFPLISQMLTKFNVPHECPIDLLPDRFEIAKHYIDWLNKPEDNFITRIVIEDLINTGAAKVSGARPTKKTKQTTIETRIKEETYIANLWESVDKKHNLHSLISSYGGPSGAILKIKDSFAALVDSFKNFSGENAGEFSKRLSLIAGIWSAPNKLAEDILTIVELLGSKRPTGVGSVELKTMRKAKGLEADVVFIIGLEDDIIPNPKSDITEEARLFYVSMTRAKENLFLLHSYKRPRNISYGDQLLDKKRSQFLEVLGRKSKYIGN
jgi:DNA helicase-2/ATP-dependent DNA helicase PcrA